MEIEYGWYCRVQLDNEEYLSCSKLDDIAGSKSPLRLAIQGNDGVYMTSPAGTPETIVSVDGARIK